MSKAIEEITEWEGRGQVSDGLKWCFKKTVIILKGKNPLDIQALRFSCAMDNKNLNAMQKEEHDSIDFPS